MEPYEVAEQTADVIERVGWAKYGFRDHRSGGVCILGGATLAAGGRLAPLTVPQDTARFQIAFAEHLAAAGLIPSNVGVSQWNDTSATDADTVITELRNYAAKHRPDAMRHPGTG